MKKSFSRLVGYVSISLLMYHFVLFLGEISGGNGFDLPLVSGSDSISWAPPSAFGMPWDVVVWGDANGEGISQHGNFSPFPKKRRKRWDDLETDDGFFCLSSDHHFNFLLFWRMHFFRIQWWILCGNLGGAHPFHQENIIQKPRVFGHCQCLWGSHVGRPVGLRILPPTGKVVASPWLTTLHFLTVTHGEGNLFKDPKRQVFQAKNRRCYVHFGETSTLTNFYT